MAASAAKRRKLEHVSSDDEDEASFASFGSEEEEQDAAENGIVGYGVDGEASEREGSDGSMDGDDQDGEDENEHEEETRPSAGRTAARDLKNTTGTSNGIASGSRPTSSGAYATGTFKSSLFKLQVDELLEQMRPRHGKRENEAEAALHKIKQTIDKLPDKDPLSVTGAEKDLRKTHGVAIPFPSPRPPKDAKYKLAYAKPAGVNVAGSHPLKLASRGKSLEIDMVVSMPSTLFQDKDYLNHRYFYKRAYYLACLASGLKSVHQEDIHVRYENFGADPLKPVLVAESKRGRNEATAKARWRVNIIPCITEDTFSLEKLLPSKNCVRDQTAATNGAASKELPTPPTPFYNSSLRAEMLAMPYLKLLNTASKTCDAFRDTCLLGGTWLRQRGIASDLHAGGFGSFEWSTLVALLLQGGGPGGRSLLSDRYSSYQLLKATLQVLAVRDLSKQPLIAGPEGTLPGHPDSDLPVVWDAVRSHNMLYKMSPWSYKKLREEARTTLKMLNDPNYDGFEAAFVQRVDNALYQYDHVAELADSTTLELSSKHADDAQQSCRRLYSVLLQGLGDRIRRIDIIPHSAESWALDNSTPGSTTSRKLRIGFAINPDTVNRTVDHGPSAEHKGQAAAFRKFWGDKAELRRFKDGTISETVVWNAGESVLEQIVRYLLRWHFGGPAADGLTFAGDGLKKKLPHGSTAASFSPIQDAFKQFEADVRGLDGLPLTIRQLSPADAQLRSAANDVPMRTRRPKPANVVLQFEGSARWPDDLIAIQRTKVAFLLKLSDLISGSLTSATPRIGLENEGNDMLNQAFLDVIYDSGAAFRIRIHHDREQTLLERMLKDKTVEPSAKDTAAVGLAMYKRDYIKAPAHTQAFAGLCSRYPALSGTIRLLKQWFDSHLLFNHIPEEIIELIAARTFVQPWPWQAPSSVQAGFYRTLNWLTRWDWRNDPLIVDFSEGGDLKQAERQSIATKFEAWRKLDPALNRVVLFAASNVDAEGTTWTDGRPSKVVAGRMSALAKAARAEIEERQLQLEPASLFLSPLSDFDFVLHLDPELAGKKRKSSSKQAAFKNLEIDHVDDEVMVGFDPMSGFTNELGRLYGSAILFFSGGNERAAIAGLWNPQTSSRPWTLHLSYSTTPLKSADKEKAQAEVNRDAILAEIACLGGDMVRRVEVNRH
ncbi:U3 snoRNP protein [Saxophila tyrrhenica]|uniref:U3 small nucleolar RNA-associated protein 22 n=1 Tax=Saxophila tyrrhenica TaxID=1690608 RepID=A0AAV9PHI5_9PEZI|nr:U3 snoRNP protein [Saxophila tyrrhenica]